mmetsp:Transcript_120480/g.312800  ORF Transcript_120480/g.312800 Transcript_120480/m.312800 type:complete len:236 (-) Transcript_120480:696-1403(-)
MPLAATSSIMAAFRITACRTVATRRPCSTTARWTSSRAMTRRTRFSSSTPSTCCTPLCRSLSRISPSWTSWSRSRVAAQSTLPTAGYTLPWSSTWTPWLGKSRPPSRPVTCTRTRSSSSCRTTAAQCMSLARPTTTRSRGASIVIGKAASAPMPSSLVVMCQRTVWGRPLKASSPSPIGIPHSAPSQGLITLISRPTRPTITSSSTVSQPCRPSMADPNGTTLSVARTDARTPSI